MILMNEIDQDEKSFITEWVWHAHFGQIYDGNRLQILMSISFQGISGTPLQLASKDNKCVYHIIGFITFGPRCATPGIPVVYTRVSSYLDWIESIVWPEAK